MAEGTFNGSSVEIQANVVSILFTAVNHERRITIDRATAARLINQLRRALDDDYNRAINERPGGSDDYRCQHDPI